MFQAYVKDLLVLRFVAIYRALLDNSLFLAFNTLLCLLDEHTKLPPVVIEGHCHGWITATLELVLRCDPHSGVLGDHPKLTFTVDIISCRGYQVVGILMLVVC